MVSKETRLKQCSSGSGRSCRPTAATSSWSTCRATARSVRLTGMCAGCPSAHMTLYMGVEMALRDEIKEFEQLQVV